MVEEYLFRLTGLFIMVLNAKRSRAPGPKSASLYGSSGAVVWALSLVLVCIGFLVAFYEHASDMSAVFPLPITLGQRDNNHSGQSSPPAQANVRLTREGIDLLLDSLDHAMRQKDVEGVLRHIAPDATILIHMKQGSQQQMVTLTREEYGRTLRMSFAFPSANDYARTGTTVSVTTDERSAKVAFKSTETLRHAQRELKIEGEATLGISVLDHKPMIVTLDQVMPGDST